MQESGMLAAAAAAAAANHHARKVAVKVLVNNNGQPSLADLAAKSYPAMNVLGKTINPALFAPQNLMEGSPILKHFAGVYGVDFTKNPEYKALLQESYHQAMLQSLYGQHLGVNYPNISLPYMYYPGHPAFGLTAPCESDTVSNIDRVDNRPERDFSDNSNDSKEQTDRSIKINRIDVNENSNCSMASNIEIEN